MLALALSARIAELLTKKNNKRKRQQDKKRQEKEEREALLKQLEEECQTESESSPAGAVKRRHRHTPSSSSGYDSSPMVASAAASKRHQKIRPIVSTATRDAFLDSQAMANKYATLVGIHWQASISEAQGSGQVAQCKRAKKRVHKPTI